MGLRSAAYICQRVTNAIVHAHRQFGYWSINYLDDFGLAEKAENAWSSYNLMGHIMNAIGVKEAQEKSVPPTTRMEFLGNTVDTVKKTIEVSEIRKNELLQLCHKWQNMQFFTKKQLQSLIGKLSFVTNCIRPGRIFISRLLQVLRGSSEQEKHEVTDEIKQDLRWWQEYLPSFKGVSILWLHDSLCYEELLASDASLVGGRAVHHKEFFHVKFPQWVLVNMDNIAQRKMITICIAVKLWPKELSGRVVRFYTDNENCMNAINHGRAKDEFMLQCIREIAWVCAHSQILLRLRYISSRSNTLPDALSRWYQSAEARRKVKRMTNSTWKRRSIQLSNFKFESLW